MVKIKETYPCALAALISHDGKRIENFLQLYLLKNIRFEAQLSKLSY